MPDKIYVKHYFGNEADRPEEVENGAILYEADTRALFVDQNNQRTRYNPPANWNETNVDDPSYIENKPELGTVAAKDVADKIDDSENIPTSKMVKDAIGNANVWIKSYPPDSWEEIIENDNYATDYQLGKLINLDFGEFGIHQMELIAINKDIRADGDQAQNNGKAKMTWMCKDFLSKVMMTMDSSYNFTGWDATIVMDFLKYRVRPQLPDVVRNNIVTVDKSFYYPTLDNTKVWKGDIWIPSVREMFNGIEISSKMENSGVDYTDYFATAESKIKKDSNGVAGNWFLRTAYSNDNKSYCSITNQGEFSFTDSLTLENIVPCFCL